MPGTKFSNSSRGSACCTLSFFTSFVSQQHSLLNSGFPLATTLSTRLSKSPLSLWENAGNKIYQVLDIVAHVAHCHSLHLLSHKNIFSKFLASGLPADLCLPFEHKVVEESSLFLGKCQELSFQIPVVVVHVAQCHSLHLLPHKNFFF